jgi:hypothetical protein
MTLWARLDQREPGGWGARGTPGSLARLEPEAEMVHVGPGERGGPPVWHLCRTELPVEQGEGGWAAVAVAGGRDPSAQPRTGRRPGPAETSCHQDARTLRRPMLSGPGAPHCGEGFAEAPRQVPEGGVSPPRGLSRRSQGLSASHLPRDLREKCLWPTPMSPGATARWAVMQN